MDNLRRIEYKTAADTWKLAIAQKLKATTEELGLLTKPAAEWVRVADLAGIYIEVDLSTRTFNVSADTKPLLENLTREYLLVGVKKGGQGNG